MPTCCASRELWAAQRAHARARGVRARTDRPWPLAQVLSPISNAMTTAAPALKTERAAALTTEFEESLARLDLACREGAADRELSELEAIEKEIGEFLALAEKLKFDTTAREDINGYSGATPVLYNKFLFRAG